MDNQIMVAVGAFGLLLVIAVVGFIRSSANADRYNASTGLPPQSGADNTVRTTTIRSR